MQSQKFIPKFLFTYKNICRLFLAMAHRIETTFKDRSLDTQADNLKRQIHDGLGIAAEVEIIDAANIDGNLSPEALRKLGDELFSDPVIHVNSPSSLASGRQWDFAIEVGYKPGVTDNTGEAASEAMKYVIGESHPVYCTRLYLLKGISAEEAAQLAEYFPSPQIQFGRVISRNEWNERGAGIYIPRVGQTAAGLELVDIDVDDETLMRIAKEKKTALNLARMSAIREYARSLGRPLTLAGLYIFDVNWSEHCRHNKFNGLLTYEEDGVTREIDSLFKTYIRGATEEIIRRGFVGIKSVFSDNAGIRSLSDKFVITDKAETHNAPSAKQPYWGSITGGDGLERDTAGAGLGAMEIARADVLCFGDPFYKGKLPPGVLHPKRVYDGVRAGIRDGGNKCGRPTVNGSMRFDSYSYGSVVENGRVISYLARPLVYVRSVGIMPAEINGLPSHSKNTSPGDAIVLVGGRTGRDGIFGASFSSIALGVDSPTTAVQIDEPYTQRKMFDFLREARDMGLYKDITDNGAGGIACSVYEMACKSRGADVDLAKVKTKYAGMSDDEIFISESQDRMTVSVHPSKIPEFMELAARRGAEASVIGSYNSSGRFRVVNGERQAVDLDIDFIERSNPRERLKGVWKRPCYPEPDFAEPDLGEALEEMLSRPNIASKESTVRTYDHEVLAQTVVKPFTGANNDGPSDAAVIWPLEMERRGSPVGIAMSHGINPNYGLIDTYHMAALNITEAINNAVASGADPRSITLLDNFCWSSPSDPYRVAQLERACRACYDYTVAYGTPFVSGKDSMSNDFDHEPSGTRISVPPTLLISALGIVPDIKKAVTMDAKKSGSLIYVIGMTYGELGGSEYFAMMGSKRGEAWIGKRVPNVHSRARIIHERLYNAIQNGLVSACHDCSDGGLGVTLTEMAFAGDLGMKINLDLVPRQTRRNDYTLFSESSPRFVVEVPQQCAPYFNQIMGITAAAVGETKKGRFDVYSDGRNIISAQPYRLRDAWQKTLSW